MLGGVPGGLGIRQVNEQTEPAVVMATEALHPVMRGVGVGRLEILNAPTWKGSRGVTELMSGPSGGLVFAAEPVGRRVVAVGFDPMESNWPALPGFVAFLANTASGSQKFQRPMRMSRVMCFDCKEFLVRTQCCRARLERRDSF